MSDLQAQINAKLAATGYCKALHARITPTDCARLKGRSANWAFGGEISPPQCATCNGLDMPTKKPTKGTYKPIANEDNSMPMIAEKKDYTAKDIAKLSNVSDAYIHNLHYLVRKSKPLPNSVKTKTVLNTLAELGISLGDIVKIQGWKNANIKQAAKCLAKQTAKHDTPKTESLETGVTKILKEIEQPQTQQSSELINDIMDIAQKDDFTDSIQGAAPPKAPPVRAGQKPVPSLAEFKSLPTAEPTIDLSDLPLEALIVEIIRRLPRAELVLR